MKGYQNLKLKTKLLISFALMALVAVVIGVVGIVSINMLHREDKEMYEENTMPMGELAVMYDNLASQRISAANMVVFFDNEPAFTAAETASLGEKEALFEEALAFMRAPSLPRWSRPFLIP